MSALHDASEHRPSSAVSFILDLRAGGAPLDPFEQVTSQQNQITDHKRGEGMGAYHRNFNAGKTQNQG